MATADETKFLEEIGEDFLCCTICLEEFKSPKILPCLHTFCESCLVTLVEKAGALNCPECRQQHQLPDGGVPAIKGNFFMKNMVEIFKQRLDSVQGRELKCEGCQENTASHRCMECKQYLCNSCIKVHKNLLLTRTHKPMTIEEYETAKSTSPVSIEAVEYCTIHTENKVEFFCETCQVPVCTNCTIVKHRIPEHVHRDLKDAADEYLTELKAMVDKLKVKEREAEKNKTLAKQIHSDLAGKCSTEKGKVRMKAEEIIEKIKREEQRLLNELKSNYKIKLKNAAADIDEMELKHGNIKSACSFIETLMHHGNAVQLLSTKSDACNRIKQLITMETEPKTQHDEVVFTATDDINEHGILGILQSDVCISKCTVENIPKQLSKGDSAGLLITTRDSTGKQVIPKQPVTVKIQKPDASWEDTNVSDNRDGTHRVRVCGQMDGKYQINITIDSQAIPGCPVIIPVIKGLVNTIGSRGGAKGQFNFPHSVAINKDGDIVTADRGNNRLQITCTKGRFKKMLKFTQFKEPFMPCDIAISSDNTYYSLDSGNKQVIVSDENGSVIRSFGENELKDPQCIAISPVDGKVYVTDGSDDCVRVYTKRGKYLRSFGSKGEGQGEFKGPKGIVVGSTGMVFVADYYNKRIQVFNSRDQYLYSFNCMGEHGQLRYPERISIKDDKYVYVVGQKTFMFDVFSEKHIPNSSILRFDIMTNFVCCIDSYEDGLKNAKGIALTGDMPQKVIVADCGDHCIKMFIE
ncbi:tripartite motif-containing protein 2-like [Ptychodera flava]|uniref:tripartite motif-containing protein 2-like n=1 Tax=Ptychodera flava TaxID=63121 RepID=UPI00396A8D37